MKLFINRHGNRSNGTGFSLLETIIAIAVLTLAMTAVFTLVSLGIRSVSLASNELTASFLASEGIEYIRNVRDGNVLNSHPFLNTLSECESSAGCAIDVFNDVPPLSCPVMVCPRLRFDPATGLYSQVETNGDAESIFTRRIVISNVVVGEEVRVQSTVSWQQFPGALERTFTVETNLFNTNW